MEYEAVISPARNDESSRAVRVPWPLWLKVLRAVEAKGGLLLDRYTRSESRQFVQALLAALEPPPPRPPAPARYAVFAQTPADPGLPLRDEAVRADVEAVLDIFERGGVLVERAITASLRGAPARTSTGLCRREALRPARPSP